MTAWRSEAELLAAVERMKGAQRLEGLEVSAEQEALILRHQRGEITHEEFVRLVVELAKRGDSPAA